MKLEMSAQMRMEQKMKLAPRMIQSMEILQLPIMALQERIEQELNSNPVLEVEEPAGDSESEQDQSQQRQTKELPDSSVPSDKSMESFERVENLGHDYRDYMDQSGSFRRSSQDDAPDAKLEALKNTEAAPKSLHEHLSEQWRFIEAEDSVKAAGQSIIDFIDNRGYLSVRLEQLHNKDRTDFSYDDLKEALPLVQKLEPVGVGARNLKECLLIQMAGCGDDMSFEEELVSEHMDDLLANNLPDIAEKMECSVEQINEAIKNMSKFDTSPGLQVGQARNHAISADVIVEALEDAPNDYIVRLANNHLPNLRISDYYSTMLKDVSLTDNTKKFLQNNIRSAQWIIDAIEQRKNTMLRVTESIVKHQREFFDKGELYLKPLPMSKVAEDVGVHIATVSRAVADKYLLCEWGVVALRKFFGGGTDDENGSGLSWDAIRAKLQQIIDAEDKSAPLSDDKIRRRLEEMGIKNLARRTIAKYRKLMNIPAARYRKKY